MRSILFIATLLVLISASIQALAVELKTQRVGMQPRERIHENSAGISGTSRGENLFGAAIAVGDFDGHGFDDLAVGISGKPISSVDDAGAVVGSSAATTDC